MSILIKGMEMPKTCKECIFSRYILGEWFCRTTTTLDDDGMELWETVGENGNSKRADFCPLTPIPPHGRLIDADALENELQSRLEKEGDKWMESEIKMAQRAMRVADYKIIKSAPTIIPESEKDE